MIAVALAVVSVGFALSWVFLKKGEQNVQPGLAQAEMTETGSAADALDDIRKEEMPETESESETETEPEIYVELTEDNIDGYVNVVSCEINKGTKNVVFSGSVEEKPVSDDDNFYLFEMKMYDTELNQEGAWLDTVPKEKEFSLEAPVNENSEESRLLSKFVVAVKLDGVYVPLCDPQYVTNPEALASYTAAFPERASKKGILPDPLKIRNNQLDDLGVKHAAYNIFVSNALRNMIWSFPR